MLTFSQFWPLILCLVLNLTFFNYYHYYSGSGKLLFVLPTRNLSLSLSSTKAFHLVAPKGKGHSWFLQYLFHTRHITIPIFSTKLGCLLKDLLLSIWNMTHHLLVSSSHAICIQVKFHIFLAVDGFLITSINLCHHSPLSAFTSSYQSEV